MTVSAFHTEDPLFDDVVKSFRESSNTASCNSFCSKLLSHFFSNTKITEVTSRYKKYQFQSLVLDYPKEMQDFISFLEKRNITFIPQ